MAKPWVNPFGKMSIFLSFWTSSFYSLERGFFVLEYHRIHFPGLHCVKKKVGKMAFFGPKTWVNPFGKMSIFRLFELFVFIAQKSVYFLEYQKRHFPGLYCLKKKVGKMANFGPKPWFNLFGKMSIFQLFELLVFIAQKSVFIFFKIS